VKPAFFLAVSTKIVEGGWFPLLLALCGIILMTTWWRGRQLVAERLRANLRPLDDFFDAIDRNPPKRVKGSAVFMSRNTEGTPAALTHNLAHNKILHENVILLVIQSEDVPYVDWRERITVEPLKASFYRVIARYGFLETPHVPRIVRRLKEQFKLDIDLKDCTFFLGHETLIPSKRPGMAIWREKLFAFMSRNSQRATEFFRLPPDQVVEIGLQIEL